MRKLGNQFLNIFKTFFGCFVRYLDLWATRRTGRSTIVDVLIKIPGPLNPAAYWKVHNLFKRSKICQKRSKNLKSPPWKFDKNIPECIALHRYYQYQVNNHSLYLYLVCTGTSFTAVNDSLIPTSSQTCWSTLNCFHIRKLYLVNFWKDSALTK